MAGRQGTLWSRLVRAALFICALGLLGACAPEAARLPSKTTLAMPSPAVPAASSAAQPAPALTPSPDTPPAPPFSVAAGGLTPTATPLPDSPPFAERAIGPRGETGGVAATGETGPGGPDETAGGAGVVPPRGAPSATPDAAPAPAAPVPDPRPRVVALDPGHGGPEPGASAVGLVEKEVNLKIALKLAGELRARGYRVVLTRETDRAVSPEYKGAGYAGGLGRDLQARVDLANAASADLFVSIHNNGSADPAQSGAEVWYNRERSFAERNMALARLVESGLLRQIRALGYPAVARGIKDDANFRIFQGRAYNIYVLGPGTGARPHVPTQMPAVLGESLFVSNAGDAAMLRRESTLDAIAAGYRDAIVAYFDRYP